MYFLVKIIGSKDNSTLRVPIQWVKNINMSRIFNYGLNKKKAYLMFYSSQDKDPDFSLPQSNEPKEHDFCFNGKMIKTCSKYT